MQSKQWDAIWFNGSVVTCEGSMGLIEKAALAVKDGLIAWVGPTSALPHAPQECADVIYDLEGGCLTPGFIDCHTHIVYAGNRAREFELRLQGASYEEIAKQGGGIQATVEKTRIATEAELFAQSYQRAHALRSSGVTTIEIKSGYGLDLVTEIKMLRVAERIGTALNMTVKRTFLGAHTIPKEFKDNPAEYVNLVCNEMLPMIAEQKLAERVDVFCESIAFNLAQTEQIFRAAQKYGLAITCHSEQLSDSKSAALAATYHAQSVDHLEHVNDDGIKALAAAGTVAVLLPGAFYYLRETKLPPIAALRNQHVPIAIATDSNPGTSPILSLLVILNMACTLFRLTPDEALLGVTRHAAQALGMTKSHGTLSVGKVADLAWWKVNHPAELAYMIGGNPLRQLVKAGRPIVGYACE